MPVCFILGKALIFRIYGKCRGKFFKKLSAAYFYPVKTHRRGSYAAPPHLHPISCPPYIRGNKRGLDISRQLPYITHRRGKFAAPPPFKKGGKGGVNAPFKKGGKGGVSPLRKDERGIS